ICQRFLAVDQERVVAAFVEYLRRKGQRISRAEFEQNFVRKLGDAAFREDILPLVRDGVEYDFDLAARFMLDEVLSKLPGNPWKRPE
ncbi:MAG TPA: hypothetical protein V6C72_10040, partial [Chroococcales cyanobacterium]